MSRSLLQKTLYVLAAIYIVIAVWYVILAINLNDLNKENAKFKNEIEYLKGTNEALEKDNRDKNDRIWNLYNNEMKVGK